MYGSRGFGYHFETRVPTASPQDHVGVCSFTYTRPFRGKMSMGRWIAPRLSGSACHAPAIFFTSDESSTGDNEFSARRRWVYDQGFLAWRRVDRTRSTEGE